MESGELYFAKLETPRCDCAGSKDMGSFDCITASPSLKQLFRSG